jgi:Serine protease inhibitor
MKRLLILHLFGALNAAVAYTTTDFYLAASATNQFAVDLHRQVATGNDNLCVSPYSIQNALAMAFAGAAGETQTEMARALHFPGQTDAVLASFAALQRSIEEVTTKTAEIAKNSKQFGGPSEPVTLTVANRLFAQSGHDFRQPFLALVKQNFSAAFEPTDFIHHASEATQHINNWVANQTHDRIRNLIPPGSLNDTTRIVLTNAIYLKAP